MSTPQWLDRKAYPFASHYADLPAGRMHYVDEGAGEVIVMVHGTPTWSFLYRHLIKGLSNDYRVIAPDKLGFGLSDKPEDFSYLPQDQAATLEAFIEQLGLQDITLMVHDFGGPTGLSYALNHPGNVKRIVLFNTWMWSLRDDFNIVAAGNLLASPLGHFLSHQFNFEVNVIFPYAFGDKSALTKDIHNQYRAPFPTPASRKSAAVYGGELLKSADWYDSLWAKREAIANIPTLILWGMKDPVFKPKYLEKWQTVFHNAQVKTFHETGHFVQEEQGAALVPHVATFLSLD